MRIVAFLAMSILALPAAAQPDPVAKWVHTDSIYQVAGGKIAIVNSYPKGGGRFTDAAGKEHGYVIFWFQVENRTNTPLALSMKFPPDRFNIFNARDAYLKLFLPPDTMTLEKVPMFDYGLTGLQSFLAKGFDKPSALSRTIKPKENSLFYVAVLFHYATGSARAVLSLKGQDLFFRIKAGEFASELIPCGQVVSKGFVKQ